MVEYNGVKGGDLLVGGIFNAVVIGTPTPQTMSGGYLGLNPSTIAPGILCYRKFDSQETGSFLTLNEGQWANGASEEYQPQTSNPDLSRQLLETAKAELERPVCEGRQVITVGLDGRINLKEVHETIETLLTQLR